MMTRTQSLTKSPALWVLSKLQMKGKISSSKCHQ